MFILKDFKVLVKRLIFKLEYFLFSKIIKGGNSWRIFDKAGIEGFGDNLYRLYFPIYYDKKTNRQTFSAEVFKQLSDLIEARDDRESYNEHIVKILNIIVELPVYEVNNKLPYLDNYFFGVLDAAVLYSIMAVHKPAKIIEIGSGISTRYMRYFKDCLALDTQIVCIDPAPRVDVETVADILITEPFEHVLGRRSMDLQSGDIVFMDGSHYVFQGNDTLTFFFNLLPTVPAGVIIHIHDIYLPFDYSDMVARQLWSEQYILAAMMMGGFNGFEILYPAYYMSQKGRIRQALALAYKTIEFSSFKTEINHQEGYSFWIRKI